MVDFRKITEDDLKGPKVERNLRISLALVKVIFESVYESLEGKDNISRKDIEEVEAKLNKTWSHIKSLFDSTCARCMNICEYEYDPCLSA